MLESIAKNATDFTKYGDDVIEQLIKSNGYVDDIIRCINKYGDDAVQEISKCGDDVAVIISEYGENAADDINKIYKWDFRPSDELYLKYKHIYDNPKYYDQSNGAIHWPIKDGFVPDTVKNSIIKKGTIFKRYGSSTGEFLGNVADSFESRALAPHSDGAEVYFYKLAEDCDMTTGKAAPWFGSDGGAQQFVKYKGEIYGEKYSVQDLLDLGILEDITDKVIRGEIIL